MAEITYAPITRNTQSRALFWLGQSALNIWQYYKNWRVLKRAQAHLLSLDDRMLNDIGISRSMIDAAIRDGNTLSKRTKR